MCLIMSAVSALANHGAIGTFVIVHVMAICSAIDYVPGLVHILALQRHLFLGWVEFRRRVRQQVDFHFRGQFFAFLGGFFRFLLVTFRRGGGVSRITGVFRLRGRLRGFLRGRGGFLFAGRLGCSLIRDHFFAGRGSRDKLLCHSRYGQ